MLALYKAAVTNTARNIASDKKKEMLNSSQLLLRVIFRARLKHLFYLTYQPYLAVQTDILDFMFLMRLGFGMPLAKCSSILVQSPSKCELIDGMM